MFQASVDYSILPIHMRDAAQRYLEKGIPPGDFLSSVLQNDLVSSFMRADPDNIREMDSWVRWLWDECPSEAWGNEDAYNNWIKRGGMEGIEKKFTGEG